MEVRQILIQDCDLSFVTINSIDAEVLCNTAIMPSGVGVIKIENRSKSPIINTLFRSTITNSNNKGLIISGYSECFISSNKGFKYFDYGIYGYESIINMDYAISQYSQQFNLRVVGCKVSGRGANLLYGDKYGVYSTCSDINMAFGFIGGVTKGVTIESGSVFKATGASYGSVSQTINTVSGYGIIMA